MRPKSLRGSRAEHGIGRRPLRALGGDRLLAKLNFPLEGFDASFQILDRRILQLRFQRKRLLDRRRKRIVIEHGPDLQAPAYLKTAARLSAGEAKGWKLRKVIHGNDQPLTLAVVARPEPGPGEILIRVAAAGVNRPDLTQRAGFYPPPPGAPETLGLEVSGTVEAVGPGVARWHEGEEVCALLPGGGYATYAIAHHGSVLPAPKNLSLIEAAALPETVFTVWANVFETAGLKPKERLLVHGGASGIGTTAIQMAKAHGARVAATAGDDAKVKLCERLGAERGINYKTEDFEAVVRDLGGADVVLDMVGGPYVQKNLNILNEHGRCVMIAFLKGPQAEVNLMRLMLKRLTLTGATLRSRSNEEKARIAGEVERVVWPWIEAGKLKPVIDSTFPLADAEGAHQRLQSGAHAGKVVLIAQN
jgi:NADPH:quinone reductase